ncbi:hypothetical protein CUJ91_04680 [Paraburkholderia graminis]|nr:hypothetical protein CUJ91_04680 [Paraburkholderia graminis]
MELGFVERSVMRKALRLERWINGEAEPYLILDWLGMDNWTPSQALYLLVGFQPPVGVPEVLNEGDNFELGTRLDGLDMSSTFEDLTEHWTYYRLMMLQDARRALKRLIRMWNSADRPTRENWRFFVKWLASKGFQPDWLQWVESRGFHVDPAESSTKAADDEPSSGVIDPVQPLGHLMALAVEVQKRFWSNNFDPTDRATWTSQDIILEWIRERQPGISGANASAVEKVACPVDRSVK